jgi:hypothetical protein
MMNESNSFQSHGTYDRLPHYGKGKHKPCLTQSGIHTDVMYKNHQYVQPGNAPLYNQNPSAYYAPPSSNANTMMCKRGELAMRVIDNRHIGAKMQAWNTGQIQCFTSMNGKHRGLDIGVAGIVTNDASTGSDPGRGALLQFGTQSMINTSRNHFNVGATLLANWNPCVLPKTGRGDTTEPLWKYGPDPEDMKNGVNYVGQPEDKFFPDLERYIDCHVFQEKCKIQQRIKQQIEQYGPSFIEGSTTDFERDSRGYLSYIRDDLQYYEVHPQFHYAKLCVFYFYMIWCFENNGVPNQWNIDDVECIKAINGVKNAIQEFDVEARETAVGDFQTLIPIDQQFFEQAHPSLLQKDLLLTEKILSPSTFSVVLSVMQWFNEFDAYSHDRMESYINKRLVGVVMNCSAPGGQLDVMLRQRGA